MAKQFKGFSEDQMKRIAQKLGYEGPMSKFSEFLSSNPGAQRKFSGLNEKVKLKMQAGGAVRKYQEGGLEMGASVIPTYVNPQTGQQYLNRESAPNPSALVPYQPPAYYGPKDEVPIKPMPVGPGFPDTLEAGRRAPMPGQTYAEANPSLAGLQAGIGSQPLQQAQGNFSLRDLATDQDFYATGTPEYNAQLAQQNAQTVEGNFLGQPSVVLKPGSELVIPEGGMPQGDIGKVTPEMIAYMQRTEASTPVTQPTQPIPSQYTPTYEYEAKTPGSDADIVEVAGARMSTPGLPVGGTTIAQSTAVEPGQFMATGTGEVAGTITAPTTLATTAQADQVARTDATQMDATQTAPRVAEEAERTEAAQGSVTMQMEAQEADATATEVGTVPAAQIAEATRVDQPQSRTLQSGELIQGAADASKASAFVEQVDAAQADPSSAATVQGQLANLMTDFEDGQTPAWAAGALRNANATLAARGLGASSIAGQAIVQAAMEAALPIASQDASVVAKFELENLSNRQQRAMLAAEQRAQFMQQEFDQEFQSRVANASKISEIANINFNADQQVALENARMAQTVDLNNLSNQQALVMAEAAQIASLEAQNLNNRQQASLQNAQAFLQMDMTNLSNEQQTEMFKAQSRIQSIMSDAAAENAAKQFNATSQNQTDQFFASMQNQIQQFNATQSNAQSQFNAGASNSVAQFNSTLQNQRDQFNAQNQLVIEQSNAQWRRQIATADTAAVNRANEINAQAILNISNLAYSNLWTSYRDAMEWAWTSTENERERDMALATARIAADADTYAADKKEDADNSAAWGNFVFEIAKGWF